MNIREFYVCVCPSLRFGFIIYLIMGRLCVILYAIYASLSFQALSDGLGLNAIEFLNISIFRCFKDFLPTILWSCVPSAVAVTKFEQLQCKLNPVA